MSVQVMSPPIMPAQVMPVMHDSFKSMTISPPAGNAYGNTDSVSSDSVSDADDDFEASSAPGSPIIQPKHLDTEPTLLLCFTSYSSTQPLQPEPDLKYDLRSFPSPDKHMRSRFDGRSKRLREWVRKEGWYKDMFEKAEKEILEKGKKVEEEEKEEAAKKAAEPKVEKEVTAEPEKEVEETKETETAEPAEVKKEVIFSDEVEEVESNAKAPRVVRVGVCCEMGRHRSVAVVEELSRMQWPDEWAVELIHRDVDRARKQRKGKAGRREKGGRKNSIRSDGSEDD